MPAISKRAFSRSSGGGFSTNNDYLADYAICIFTVLYEIVSYIYDVRTLRNRENRRPTVCQRVNECDKFRGSKIAFEYKSRPCPKRMFVVIQGGVFFIAIFEWFSNRGKRWENRNACEVPTRYDLLPERATLVTIVRKHVVLQTNTPIGSKSKHT